MQENESFIDVDDLAKFLKLKKQTTYHVVATQNIPHYRVGRLIRFKLSEVEEWMKSNKAEQFNMSYTEIESM